VHKLPFLEDNAPIGNMASYARKRGYSVTNVAEGTSVSHSLLREKNFLKPFFFEDIQTANICMRKVSFNNLLLILWRHFKVSMFNQYNLVSNVFFKQFVPCVDAIVHKKSFPTSRVSCNEYMNCSVSCFFHILLHMVAHKLSLVLIITVH